MSTNVPLHYIPSTKCTDLIDLPLSSYSHICANKIDSFVAEMIEMIQCFFDTLLYILFILRRNFIVKFHYLFLISSNDEKLKNQRIVFVHAVLNCTKEWRTDLN